MKYDELIKDLIRKFEKSISEDENKEEIVKNFEKHIHRVIGFLNNDSNKIYEKFGLSIEECIKKIGEKNINMSLEEKKDKFIVDWAFNRIIEISRMAYREARHLLEGKEKIEKLDKESLKKELEDLLKNVQSKNMINAQYEVSEAMLDINYVCNPESDIRSLRIGRLIRSMM